jgi:hypothetical protein
LEVAKGLLEALNADYAAVRFTDDLLNLDVLIHASSNVSRFTVQRNPGEDPAATLYRLVDDVSAMWHAKRDQGGSRQAASEAVLMASKSCDVGPESIIPVELRCGPAMTREQKRALHDLKVSREELETGGKLCLDSAFRQMARLCHPDIGGSQEKMLQANAAFDALKVWLDEGMSSSRRGKPARDRVWCFVGKTARWIPPR